jgi:hypothetical protein
MGGERDKGEMKRWTETEENRDKTKQERKQDNKRV